eukprot:m.16827 g.16827  ORF g.16827 m.16827 type:complete len:469 (+) comp11228_c0_seq1:307-1713(+)
MTSLPVSKVPSISSSPTPENRDGTENDEAIARAMLSADEIALLEERPNIPTKQPAFQSLSNENSRSAATTPVMQRKELTPNTPSSSSRARFFSSKKGHKRSKSSGDTKVQYDRSGFGSRSNLDRESSLTELASGTYTRLRGRFDGWRDEQRALADQRDGAYKDLSANLAAVGLQRPQCQELTTVFKKFMIKFEQLCRNPTVNVDVMSEAVIALYDQVDELTSQGSVWTTMETTMLENAESTFEHFLMDQIFDLVFFANEADEEKDLALSEKIRSLRWLTEDHLDAMCNLENNEVKAAFELAQDSLILVDSQRPPDAKLDRVVTASKAIFDVITISNEGKPAGADDFMPVLIYTIVKANPPMLYSNLQYVTRFCNPKKLNCGEAGYFYTNLFGAVSFIEKIDAESLKISPKEFERQMKVNELSNNMPAMSNHQVLLDALEGLAELDILQKKISSDLDVFHKEFAMKQVG